jgi:hypothetical protein
MRRWSTLVPTELGELPDQVFRTGGVAMDREEVIIDLTDLVGDDVLCDFCNADYTNLPDSGGYIVHGWAVCPACAPDFSKRTEESGEAPPELLCPYGMSFADFVRMHR